MRTALLDTVGLLALWEKRDQWHDDALRSMKALNLEQARLVTTSSILYECGNAAARKPYRADVDQLRTHLLAAGRLIVPSAQDEEDAWREYRQGASGAAGIVDHVSFMVMRKFAITDAFTNDRHFKAAGFKTLF